MADSPIPSFDSIQNCPAYPSFFLLKAIVNVSSVSSLYLLGTNTSGLYLFNGVIVRYHLLYVDIDRTVVHTPVAASAQVFIS